jgi:hypothetical protein
VKATLAAAVVVALAGTAYAQGYTAEDVSGRLVERPASAARVDFADGAKTWAVVTMPFAFRWYGRPGKSLVVSAHRWLRPGATEGFDGAPNGTFPLAAGEDGVVAPLWSGERASVVFTWAAGEAPSRVFVVSWEADGAVTQAQLHEGAGRIVFAYRAAAVTGAPADAARPLVGLDEPDGARFVAPKSGARGRPPGDVVFEPRTVLVNSPLAPKRGEDVTWQDIRRESITGPGSAEGACYVAKGGAWMFVPDRVLTGALRSRRLPELVAEDAARFGGKGDAERFVKQVLDAKAVLLPRDGGAPERVWFRIVEWFTVEETGLAGPDEHVWNLRAMLKMAFPEGDPRARIDHYVAWRGMVRARFAVVKLFDARQTSDAAPQYDTNRKGEYVLWCAKFHTGPLAALLPDETPEDGWTRFPLEDENLGRVAEQHAEKRDLREVRDPEYVDGGYEYVVRSRGPVPGWEALPGVPRSALADEAFDDGTTPRPAAPTPR